MKDNIRMAIIDYMNLVFGSGDETNDFWATVLLPYASQYYSYPMDDLNRASNYLNALFFAFTTHFGIKFIKQTKVIPVVPAKNNAAEHGGRAERFAAQLLQQSNQMKDDDYFKDFGKTETPFG